MCASSTLCAEAESAIMSVVNILSCIASGQPNIGLTPDEKRVFGQLFAAADSENLGVVTGELAVKFFEKSGLNPRILGEVWVFFQHLEY